MLTRPGLVWNVLALVIRSPPDACNVQTVSTSLLLVFLTFLAASFERRMGLEKQTKTIEADFGFTITLSMKVCSCASTHCSISNLLHFYSAWIFQMSHF